MDSERLSLNAGQKSAVQHEGHICLTACPGSGKTRAIVAKVLRCGDALEGGTRRVGCITYTNSGVAEIESRLRQQGGSVVANYAEVGTIHSFCLNNIVRPYHRMLRELQDGYEVTPPDCEWFQEVVRNIALNYGLKGWVRDRFRHIQRQPDGSLRVPDGIPLDAAIDLYTQMASVNRISLSDIVFYSFRILSKFPFICRNVSSRFQWLVVDEFQDTTVTQVEILKLIHSHRRTEFFMVGDPNQSILGFTGARPDLMGDFGVHIRARSDIVLNENYRCSQKIVEVAERLYRSAPKMVAAGKWRGYPVVPTYDRSATAFDCIWDYFLPTLDELEINLGNSAILAPWWITLFEVGRQLRDHDVPIVGRGSRPYKGDTAFAQFAESTGAYLSTLDVDEYARLRRAFFWLVLSITGDLNWRIYRFDGKRVLSRLVSAARKCRLQDESAVGFLDRFVSQVGIILVSEDYISESDKALLRESADTMIEGIESNLPDPANVSVDFLSMFARPMECLQLLTMHSAKGREFDAVAVIDVHDDKVPHWTAEAEEVEEAKRLMYVASTRARKLLMFFSDTSDSRNRPSRFLGAEGLQLV